MRRLDIIIVNYKSAASTTTLVGKLLRDTSDFQVIVVNNDQDEREYLLDATTSADPRLVVIEAGRNLGYSKAANLGASKSNAEALAFLNPDVEIGTRDLLRLLSAMRSANAVLSAPRLVDETGAVWRTAFTKELSWRAILVDAVMRGRAEQSTASYLFRNLLGANHSYGSSRYVAALTGAIWIIDRSWFDALHGFDEDFFLFGEESDLCRRLIAQGGKIWFESTMCAVHLGGQSYGGARMTELRLWAAQLQFAKMGRPYSAAVLRGLALVAHRRPGES